MPKIGANSSRNGFILARLEAIKVDSRFSDRERAAEVLDTNRTRLMRIELGKIEPRPDEVLRMAVAYNAPELLNYYCSRICPIGKDTVPHIELSTFDRMARKGLAAIRRAKIAENILIRIAPDGEIREGEEAQLLKVLHILQSIEKVTLEMEIYIKKNLKGCE